MNLNRKLKKIMRFNGVNSKRTEWKVKKKFLEISTQTDKMKGMRDF